MYIGHHADYLMPSNVSIRLETHKLWHQNHCSNFKYHYNIFDDNLGLLDFVWRGEGGKVCHTYAYEQQGILSAPHRLSWFSHEQQWQWIMVAFIMTVLWSYTFSAKFTTIVFKNKNQDLWQLKFSLSVFNPLHFQKIYGPTKYCCKKENYF